jgi:hypothetical protein
MNRRGDPNRRLSDSRTPSTVKKLDATRSIRPTRPRLPSYCAGTVIKPLSIAPDLWNNEPVAVVYVIEKRFRPNDPVFVDEPNRSGEGNGLAFTLLGQPRDTSLDVNEQIVVTAIRIKAHGK